MISLSFRTSLVLFAATWFAFGPGPQIAAQGVDCASLPCPPLTSCPNCPTVLPLVLSATVPPRDLGPRFNVINVPTFPSTMGSLERAEVTITVQPGECYYRVENLGTTSCDLQPAPDNDYDVRGYLDVGDPTILPPLSTFLCTTSDKVDGEPGSSNCLKWRVQDPTLDVTFNGTPDLPIADGCYDFNDPEQDVLAYPPPSIVIVNCPPSLGPPFLDGTHGGPCETVASVFAPGGCCLKDQLGVTYPVAMTPFLGGLHERFGRSVTTLGCRPPFSGTILPDAQRSGYTDRRTFGIADAYQTKVCITDMGRLNFLKSSTSGPSLAFPLRTKATTLFPSWTCSNLDQEERITIGVTVEVKYYFCPPAPVCVLDSADVCRTVGSMTSINVLANDGPQPAGVTIDCAARMGTANLTQGTYGTVQWIDDPACVNTLCNQRCVKYTLTSIPPAGVTTDTFNYTIQSTNGCTATCPVTVRICSPVCVADTGVVCDTSNAMTLVNVLGNDSNPCTTAFNCVGLTGAAGLTQGTYGTVAWVTDASLANGLCNQRGIKYTRNSTPLPAGVFTDTFNYTIATSNPTCIAVCPVTITICSPRCQPDSGRVCRTLNSNVLINVLGNDTSNCAVNCAGLTGATNVTQGTYGSVAWVTDPTLANGLCNQKGLRYNLTALPPAGVTTDSFTYTFTDSNGCAATCQVTITICSPACVADTATVCRILTGPTSTTLINVLVNDTANCAPINCAALTGAVGLTQGTYGSTSWANDASLTNALCNLKGVRYTLTSLPPAGVFTDSFNYTFTDANGCPATCPVTVTICSPVCLPDVGSMCRTVGTTALVNVLANDTDNCAVNCGALINAVGLTQGTYGTVAWTSNALFTNSLCNLKGITYTLNSLPPTNPATDTFSYTYTDSNGCSATCSVVITICSPTCQSDTGDVCKTVGSMAVVNVLNNDITCRPLNCGLLTGTTGLTQGTYGTVAWVSDASATNGHCNLKAPKYTLNSIPPAGVTQDSFTYTITDTNGCSCTSTVVITIASPVCAADCTDVCATVGSMATINVLANDTSPRPLNCALLTGTGGLTQGTYGSVAWVADGGCSNSLCTGKCVKYTVTAVPPAGVNMDTFTYTITDTNGCPSTCTVQVKFCKIDAVNDGPLSTCQGVPFRICVLDNDTSTCGLLGCANLSIITAPTNGNVQIIQDCANLPTSCQTPLGGCTGCCLVYTPNTGFSGTETFTYRISTTATGCPGGTPITCTDTATVTIVVKPSPTAVDDSYQLTMNGTVGPFDVRDNDSPGVGCEFTGCGGACVFVSCPEITMQPSHGTVAIDPVTCRMIYTATPGVVFPGSDTFCYRVVNNCGCCDIACVTIADCPMINRNEPGSLLIYPEFDNRPGRTTYVTITNTSCAWPNAGTWVEFIYIEKSTCLETNRTAFLTPCDTLTVITSSHNPNTGRGFMYAFAKDSLGRPVAFNHLIGDLLIADGVDGHQYAVNPVVFRSPVPRGGFTDLDGDDIRDLNGIEYDQAPDTLLIPRFLGQDPPGAGVFQSELVVLGLSGGVSFETVIGIIGFNDNEVPFSVTKQFYCWEKWKLTDISNAFTNTYLQNSGDDPLEIIGDPTRESGWFRIDGLTAFSDIETILDPAIYAFLVERHLTSDRGAELPFEVCAQSNGDLQPKSPLGDGPIPVAGDNQ